jgi:Dullard-like phosphatase family protein
LVFDLDETLVRVELDNPSKKGFKYDVKYEDFDSKGGVDCLYIMKRPGLENTLKILCNHFELILFTAGSETYADIVLGELDIRKYFDHVLSRMDCYFINGVFVKDLEILLSGRSLSDLLIIDNKAESYAMHIENGIPIDDYIGGNDDNALSKLTKFLLKKCKGYTDVREVVNHEILNKAK